MFLQESHTIGSELKRIAQKVVEKLHTVGIFLSFIIAFALWLYVSLNNQYTAYITVPLEILIDDDRAIENIIRPNIEAEVRSTGWDLFNLIYLNNSKKCIVDLRDLPSTMHTYELTYSKLIQSISSMEKAEIKKTNPESITIHIANISRKTVPIIPDISLILRQGFTLVGDIELNPNLAEIKGFGGILDSINSVSTIYREIKDVHSNISQNIPIKDTLPKIIKINPTKTNFQANVQLKSGLMMEQVPIRITNGKMPDGHQIMPLYVKIYVEGGVDELANFDITTVIATLTQNEINNDSTGLIVPTIQLPKNLKLVSIDPPYVYHYIRKSGKL